MAQKVAKVGVKKEKGYLYFVDKHGDVSCAKMARGSKKAGRQRRSPRSVSRRWGDTSTSSTSTVTFLAPRWSVEAKRKKQQKENSVTFFPTSPCLGKTSSGHGDFGFRHFRLYRKMAKNHSERPNVSEGVKGYLIIAMKSDYIIIRGAKEHNLKNIDLKIPRNKFIVVTGLSGSGKSSLAFDTIYAEGQRRYVESLSAYARQFLEQLQKPDVEHISGLSPTISIEQKTTSRNPRSTVATQTEIYDYLRLLFARVGTPYCYKCDKPIERQTVPEIVGQIMGLEEATSITLLAPLIRGRKGEYRDMGAKVAKAGFARLRVDGKIYGVEDPIKLDKYKIHDIEVVIDRLIVRADIKKRLTDSVETALGIGQGLLIVDFQGSQGFLRKPCETP